MTVPPKSKTQAQNARAPALPAGGPSAVPHDAKAAAASVPALPPAPHASSAPCRAVPALRTAVVRGCGSPSRLAAAAPGPAEPEPAPLSAEEEAERAKLAQVPPRSLPRPPR